ncbi:MAG: AsnC family transcriptional regulator [Candidatus Bathyarchaeota archaeon]|nr:AsnC family transcriptional regulator [Candidatus Bathyarchaeota archaeon]
MDKVDIILCQLLMYNSRRSYRELADKLDLSVTAVHNRIQALIDHGVIPRFNASPSFLAQNAVHVIIFGNSKANIIRAVKPKLEAHGSIYWLAVGGGNVLYIGAYLRDIAELDALVRFVRENAEISEPTVGLTVSPLPANIQIDKVPKLCELDYKIIRSLKDDARKATSIIAEELGVSAKTVRRRLTRMINNYLVELSIDWYPDHDHDIITIFHVKLKKETTPNMSLQILQKHYPNTLFYWAFSNIPDECIFMVWTPTTKELKQLRESFETEPAVECVAPNIIYTGYILPCWRKNDF